MSEQIERWLDLSDMPSDEKKEFLMAVFDYLGAFNKIMTEEIDKEIITELHLANELMNKNKSL